MVRFSLPALLLLGLGAGAQAQPPITQPADASTQVQARERVRAGQRLMSTDAFAEAARTFQEAIALDPTLVMAHYGLGSARMGLKEYETAIAAFESARNAFHARAAEGVNARSPVVNVLQEQIARKESQMREAEPTGGRREGLQRQAWRQEVAAPDRLREASKQAEESKQAPQLPPGLSLALGSAYFRTGRLADAEREYRAAIEAEPKLGEPHNNLAVVLLITGRVPEAKEQLTLAEQNGYKPSAQLKADIEKAQASAPAQIP